MVKMRDFVRLLVMALFAPLLMIACSDKNVVYEQVQVIPEYGWDKSEPIFFKYSSSDTVGTYDIIVDINNDATYRNQNFWLFVKSTSPDQMVYKDTLECVLADNYGKWIGEGSGTLRHLPVLLLEGVKFPKKGIYSFELIQGMRYDTLWGIHDIGIRIVKKEEPKK